MVEQIQPKEGVLELLVNCFQKVLEGTASSFHQMRFFRSTTSMNSNTSIMEENLIQSCGVWWTWVDLGGGWPELPVNCFRKGFKGSTS